MEIQRRFSQYRQSPPSAQALSLLSKPSAGRRRRSFCHPVAAVGQVKVPSYTEAIAAWFQLIRSRRSGKAAGNQGVNQTVPLGHFVLTLLFWAASLVFAFAP